MADILSRPRCVFCMMADVVNVVDLLFPVFELSLCIIWMSFVMYYEEATLNVELN